MLERYFALLHDLADHLQLPPEDLLRTEELVIDELPVGLTYSGNEEVGDIVFFSDLGDIPQARAAAVQRVLLEANSLWGGTSGATLGIHPGSGHVVICGRVPLEAATAAGFAGVLDVFVDTAQFWRAHVSGAAAEGSSVREPGLIGLLVDAA